MTAKKITRELIVAAIGEALVDRLVEAALDQPDPTPGLANALNDVLAATGRAEALVR